MGSFKPIRTLVAENEAMEPIMGRLAVISRLQKTFADTLPASLRTSSRVAAVEGTTLIVAATNGAAAALLKQMVPRLVTRFQENQMQEQEVTAIRVIVQPDATAETGAAQRRRKGAESAAPMADAALDKLGSALSDSPLKDTVTKLQKKRERALTKKTRLSQ
jgi:hypothetical protein